MGIVLSIPPPSIALSGDLIMAKFICSDYLSQAKVYSQNIVPLNGILTLRYGGKVVYMSGVPNPDDSGNQFNSGSTVKEIIGDFQSNPHLNADFNITSLGSSIVLTAKIAGAGYDIVNFNNLAGTAEIIKPNYSIQFTLYCENIDNSGFEQIYSSNLQLRPNTPGSADVPIGDKLHDYITKDLRLNFPDMPDKNVIICKKSCRKYYFEFAERYGQPVQVRKVYKSDIYTILHGGLSYMGQFKTTFKNLIAPANASADRFLRQGNKSCFTRTNQPQYLYYFNTREDFVGRAKILIYYTQGLPTEVGLYNQTYASERKYAFDITYDSVIKPYVDHSRIVERYDMQLVSSNGTGKSEIRSYYMNYEYKPFVRYFLSWSSLGAMDTRLCYGKGSSDFILEQKEASHIVARGSDIKTGNAHSYDLIGRISFKVATGWMSRSELIANRDFFLSAFKYRYTSGLMLPIRIDSKTIGETEDGTNLYAQVFEYSYQFEDHNYTEGDDEYSGSGTGDIFFRTGSVVNPTVAGELITRLVNTYAEMEAMSVNDDRSKIYTYYIKSDETIGGELGVWTNFNGKLNPYIQQ